MSNKNLDFIYASTILIYLVTNKAKIFTELAKLRGQIALRFVMKTQKCSLSYQLTLSTPIILVLPQLGALFVAWLFTGWYC